MQLKMNARKRLKRSSRSPNCPEKSSNVADFFLFFFAEGRETLPLCTYTCVNVLTSSLCT